MHDNSNFWHCCVQFLYNSWGGVGLGSRIPGGRVRTHVRREGRCAAGMHACTYDETWCAAGMHVCACVQGRPPALPPSIHPSLPPSAARTQAMCPSAARTQRIPAVVPESVRLTHPLRRDRKVGFAFHFLALLAFSVRLGLPSAARSQRRG